MQRFASKVSWILNYPLKIKQKKKLVYLFKNEQFFIDYVQKTRKKLMRKLAEMLILVSFILSLIILAKFFTANNLWSFVCFSTYLENLILKKVKFSLIGYENHNINEHFCD